jgi:hypothetical protein
MDEHLVASSETAAVFLASRRWHGRIAEPGMAFDVWPLSMLSIVPRGCKAVVVALLGYRRKIRRWGRFDVHRVRMRTSGQKKWQQQRRQREPFLHNYFLYRRIAVTQNRARLLQILTREFQKCCGKTARL